MDHGDAKTRRLASLDDAAEGVAPARGRGRRRRASVAHAGAGDHQWSPRRRAHRGRARGRRARPPLDDLHRRARVQGGAAAQPSCRHARDVVATARLAVALPRAPGDRDVGPRGLVALGAQIQALAGGSGLPVAAAAGQRDRGSRTGADARRGGARLFLDHHRPGALARSSCTSKGTAARGSTAAWACGCSPDGCAAVDALDSRARGVERPATPSTDEAAHGRTVPTAGWARASGA